MRKTSKSKTEKTGEIDHTRAECLLKILETSTGERATAGFLKHHPDLFFRLFFGVGGHSQYVLSEFGLGKELRADFVVVQSNSCGWKVKFVELEPAKDPIFNKDRTPSPRLRLAQKQIADWQRYVHEDEPSIRRQLASGLKNKDILGWEKPGAEPCTFSNLHLRDPKTYIRFEYHIVIGRRDSLEGGSKYLRASNNFEGHIEIISYDRLIDVARALDQGVRNSESFANLSSLP